MDIKRFLSSRKIIFGHNFIDGPKHYAKMTKLVK